MTAQAEPLAPLLTRIERGDLTRLNQLCKPRFPFKASLELGDVLLKPCTFEETRKWQGNWAYLEFHCADRVASACIPVDALLKVGATAFPDLALDELDDTLRGLLLDYVLHDAMQLLEAQFKAPVKVTSVHYPHRDQADPDFSFLVSWKEEEPFPLTLWCAPNERTRILELLDTLETIHLPMDTLNTQVSFRAGHTTLSIEEFSQLQTGTGILLDGTYLTFQKIVAVIGERFVQTCTWQSIKPVLDAPLLRKADATSRFFTMGELVSDISGDNDAPFGTVKDVPVHLVFELGRIDVPLNEVETLGAGHVFDLGRPLSQSVDILAGGRRIGTGELVRVADSVGIRVTRIAT